MWSDTGPCRGIIVSRKSAAMTTKEIVRALDLQNENS